ncbi:hypothetical protein ROA7023_03771 [Roseisalinus antarcticus]|uniref:Uncharacterized protein n=1 Tax=Roseisalinus antarcticus TaxID=254357 RepID=A0A1Y5TWQ1_9RHOB|nr:hypothetical protein ROA7023_03771 [Roseisalinus antarcticus]
MVVAVGVDPAPVIVDAIPRNRASGDGQPCAVEINAAPKLSISAGYDQVRQRGIGRSAGNPEDLVIVVPVLVCRGIRQHQAVNGACRVVAGGVAGDEYVGGAVAIDVALDLDRADDLERFFQSQKSIIRRQVEGDPVGRSGGEIGGDQRLAQRDLAIGPVDQVLGRGDDEMLGDALDRADVRGRADHAGIAVRIDGQGLGDIVVAVDIRKVRGQGRGVGGVDQRAAREGLHGRDRPAIVGQGAKHGVERCGRRADLVAADTVDEAASRIANADEVMTAGLKGGDTEAG